MNARAALLLVGLSVTGLGCRAWLDDKPDFGRDLRVTTATMSQIEGHAMWIVRVQNTSTRFRYWALEFTSRHESTSGSWTFRRTGPFAVEPGEFAIIRDIAGGPLPPGHTKSTITITGALSEVPRKR